MGQVPYHAARLQPTVGDVAARAERNGEKDENDKKPRAKTVTEDDKQETEVAIVCLFPTRPCWVPLAGDLLARGRRISAFVKLGLITRTSPSDVALNDELYPRSFGAVWPSDSFPYAQFLESNFETFFEDLQSILAEDRCPEAPCNS